MEKPQFVIIALGIMTLFSGGCEKNLDARKNTSHVRFKAETEGNYYFWQSGDVVSIADNHGGIAMYSSKSSGYSVSLEYVSGNRLHEGPGVVYRASFPPSSNPGEISFCQELSADGAVKGRPMSARSSGTVLRFSPHGGCVRVGFTGEPVAEAVVETGLGTFHLKVPSGLSEGLFWMPDGENHIGKLWFVTVTRKTGCSDIDRTISVGVDTDAAVLSADTSSAVPSDVNLTSSTRTANCYISATHKSVRFYARCKGNGGMLKEDLSPVHAGIVWRDTSVSEALCDGTYIYLNTGEKAGNAVVAAMDDSGKVIWSWHLWVTDEVIKAVDAAGMSVMDRDLGALSADAGSPLSRGLKYQWGRKDPLREDSGVSAHSTMEAAITHPGLFFTGNPEKAYDWIEGNEAGLWDAVSKTLNDPCPPGWIVPEGGGHGVSSNTKKVSVPIVKGLWNTLLSTTVPLWINQAWKAASATTSAGIEPVPGLWFPASGYLSPEDGSLRFENSAGSCWTSECIGEYAYCFTYSEGGYLSPSSWSCKAAGRSVRCVKE